MSIVKINAITVPRERFEEFERRFARKVPSGRLANCGRSTFSSAKRRALTLDGGRPPS